VVMDCGFLLNRRSFLSTRSSAELLIKQFYLIEFGGYGLRFHPNRRSFLSTRSSAELLITQIYLIESGGYGVRFVQIGGVSSQPAAPLNF
jgi:hypothetical protein